MVTESAIVPLCPFKTEDVSFVPILMRSLCQGDRHLPTMTVHETLKFAFDSMSGGTHGNLMEGNETMTDDQKGLVSWMDNKYFKVKPLLLIRALFFIWCAQRVVHPAGHLLRARNAPGLNSY